MSNIKVLIISHRGNINGENTQDENSENAILKALSYGFDVEIDVWLIDNKIYLGHDEPQYKVTEDFVLNNKLWVHCKNIEALNFFKDKKNKCFWHQNDDYTLTTNNKIWTYPGKKLINGSICVMPERANYKISDLKRCYGICTDFPEKYSKMLK